MKSLVFQSILLSSLGVACASPDVPVADNLAGRYGEHFLIGAAIDARSYETHAELLVEHFNSVTMENEMKLGFLQRAEGRFSYITTDRMVDFARANDMAVRGHALVWHRQNPSWFFVDEGGETVSPERLLQRMQAHIDEVMGHFAGSVQAWDVVNEAIMDDGRLRTADEVGDDQQSQWHAILGESYIAEAFRFAHAADPSAKLFYNDYYNYLPARRDAIYALLKQLLDDGVPVHGVGLQCHLNIEPSTDPEHQSYHQTVENLEQAIMMYASLGLEVHITEMDVSLYIAGYPYTPEEFYTRETFTAEIEAKQAQRYAAFFEMFRRHRDVITSVSLWGIADDNTWLSEFSSGRQDFPLLFDVDHAPKAAYDAVVDF